MMSLYRRSYALLSAAALFVLTWAIIASAQPLTGTKTIGGTTPDYATFAAATAALSSNGVGTGGVTFQVRPGVYREFVTITSSLGMGANAPVAFVATGGVVTVSPTAISTSDTFGAINLVGCKYVTFDGIDVTDASIGANFLSCGYQVVANGTQGAQYNTIRNATITLRLIGPTYGVLQGYIPWAILPTTSGSQNNNRYLNLKISKATSGIYLSGFSNNALDTNIVIGSDSSGLGYARRTVIGAMVNDTIGGANQADGVYAENIYNFQVRDIDVRNVITTEGNFAYGIHVINSYGPISITGCRVNNMIANDNSGFFANVYGIYVQNTGTNSALLANNMVYGLYSVSPTASSTTINAVYGIYTSRHATIVNNTVLIDSLGSAASTRNYSSTAVYCTGGVDTVRNNVLANLMPNQTVSYHIALYMSAPTSMYSNTNCFYIPNTGRGVIGRYNTTLFTTLTNWQTAPGTPDLNSVSGNPNFISAVTPLNPHIVTGLYSIVNGAGIPISYIANDIDGEARDATTPDIGADEGNFISSTAPLSPSLLNPVNGSSLTGSPVILQWSHSTRGDNYDVYLSTSAFNVSNLVATDRIRNAITDTITAVSNCIAGQTYYWRVVARNGTTYETNPSTVWQFVSSRLVLNTPNGDEVFPTGTPDTILWTSFNLTGNVTIKLNRNYPTGFWETLTTTTPVSQGYYVWNATTPTTATARIAIIPQSDTVYADTSDANFTIVPQLSILRPNGGEIFFLGFMDTIRWQYFNITGNLQIKIKRGASSWSTITTVPISMQEYYWTPSGSATTNAIIALIPTSAPTLADTSNAPFTIRVRSIQMTRPNGGEQFVVGRPDTIRWNAGYSTQMTIGLCRNGQNIDSVETISDTVNALTGYYVWTPTGPYTDNAYIFILDQLYDAAQDWSDNAFHIVPAKINVYKPGGGIWYYAGLEDTVKWNSINFTGNVAIEYRATQDSAWQVLSTNLPDTGSALWTPPAGTGTSNAQISVHSTRLINGYDVRGVSSMFTLAYWPWRDRGFMAQNPTQRISRQAAWTPSIPYDNSTSNLPPLEIRFPIQDSTHTNPDSVQVSYRSFSTDNLTVTSTINRVWSILPNTENFTDAGLTLRFTTTELPVGITRPDSVEPRLRVFSSDDGGSTWIYVPGSSNCYRQTGSTNTFFMTVGGISQFSMWAISNGGIRPVVVHPNGNEVLTIGQPDTIRWTNSVRGGNVKIEINRTYPTGNWETILNSTPNDSMEVWTVTGPVTTSARIRVVSDWFSTDGDTSNANITIQNAPVPPPAPGLLTITVVNQSAVLQWNRADTLVNGNPVTVSGYRIYYRSLYTDTWSLRATKTNRNDTSFVDSLALNLDLSRYYKVQSYNSFSTTDALPEIGNQFFTKPRSHPRN